MYTCDICGFGITEQVEHDVIKITHLCTLNAHWKCGLKIKPILEKAWDEISEYITKYREELKKLREDEQDNYRKKMLLMYLTEEEKKKLGY